MFLFTQASVFKGELSMCHLNSMYVWKGYELEVSGAQIMNLEVHSTAGFLFMPVLYAADNAPF
jgi:hypothetical protein